MSDVAWTGQQIVGHERVWCHRCYTGTISLRGGAWFDPYLPGPTEPAGSYVHYQCLSKERQAELDKMALPVMEKPVAV